MELKKKKGLNLIAKILGAVTIPLIILVILTGLALRAVGTNVAEGLTERELRTAVFALEDKLKLQDDGEFIVEGTSLLKGDYDLTADTAFFDEFLEHTEVDITVFWGNTRYATSITDAAGKRVVGTTIPDELYNNIRKNGTHFTTSVNIQGRDYYGYYELLEDYGEGQEVLVFAGKDSAAVKELYNGTVRSNITFISILAAVIIVLVAVIVMTIVGAIGLSVRSLTRVADGELDVALTKRLLTRSDEVGNIARAIHSLIENLRQIVKNINKSSVSLGAFSNHFKERFGTVNTSINNVNIAVEEIANGASNQANETQTVTEQMVQMGNSVNETLGNVNRLMDNADEMRNQNQEVNSSLQELIKINKETIESVQNVQKQTNVTNAAAMQIRSAIDIISDIADQTNLLSLNASIEAARAGEHGKGFAVVAEEVRTLADQSLAAVNQITETIENLINNSNISVEVMNEVMKEMDYQSQKLSETRNVFSKLDGNINEVASAVGMIRNETNAINEVKDVVLESLESLAAISEENAASTEETAATMGELHQIIMECNEELQELQDMADFLDENVSRFSLGNQE